MAKHEIYIFLMREIKRLEGYLYALKDMIKDDYLNDKMEEIKISLLKSNLNQLKMMLKNISTDTIALYTE